MFDSRSGENREAFSKDKLKKFAADLGLDTDTFNRCLDSGKYTDLIQQQNNLARKIGVSSTPTFFINGKLIIGAQPFENFEQLIEEQLSQSGK